MDSLYKRSLHIFRRDYRLDDNTALLEALRLSCEVLPCFIFDPRQVGNNSFKSEASLQFMAFSLQELNQMLEKKGSGLFCFEGIAEEVVERLLNEYHIDAVFMNADYTPFSRMRDQRIKQICDQHAVEFHTYADTLLHEPEECLKANNEPYTVYSHFFKRASLLKVSLPVKNNKKNYFQKSSQTGNVKISTDLLKIHTPHPMMNGGRIEATQLLKNIHTLVDYQTWRNIPSKNFTTHLSAHHKFGTISIRETYAAIVDAFGRHHALINELYWRDFFTHIGYHFPHVFGGSFHQKYDAIPWSNNIDYFERWCEGMTGFPIVDAGMRELNETGYMHNRVRMITASFLTKDLHIDWRWGEKYFAQKLVDYDPAVNNGNWQWCASTGCDAQPYFRVFNPWLQQKKFDPDCLYIKRWIPQLAHASPLEIHQLAEKSLKQSDYPRPIVNHSVESQKAKALFNIK